MSARTADVVIVGAGVAGVAAALEAAARGARVRVIDAAQSAGGTARISGGGTCIAGSPVQAANGVADSPGQALEDWLAFGGPAADAVWAQRYLEASVPEVFDFLTEAGVEWLGVRHKEGNRVPRWHQPSGGGARVMGLLTRRAMANPLISWHLATPVTGLSVTGGAVTGVIAAGPDGAAEYPARSVLLACGGFNNDSEMVGRYASAARAGNRILLAGGPGARGQGHRLAHSVDADLVNMDAVWMYPNATVDYKSPEEARGLVLRNLDGEVWVNREGVRFHNEALRGGASGAAALLRQPGATCWSVIDSRIAARLTISDPAYRAEYQPDREKISRLLAESPYVASGRDLPALADRIGVDPRQLESTIAEHNRQRRLRRETDPDFGRPIAGLEPLDQAPYYAIQLFAAARKNLGGIRTDENCQVLSVADRPVGGLFAAGEVAGMAGGHVNGTAALEGTMFGPSLYSGRVAGRIV